MLCIPALLILGAVAVLGAIGCDGSDGSSAAAATSTSIAAVATSTAIAPATPTATPSPAPAFTICSDQTYALCAAASCFVLDDLAYCKCDVLSGDSISESDAFGEGQNICTVNAEGAENGYMASTFSLPHSVVAPDGNQALYNCPAATSTGAYAQCDGGLCFTSSQGQSFPGFNDPLTGGEIICSCPFTLADPATARIGYQIAGPYPCQKSFFQNCKRATASKKRLADLCRRADRRCENPDPPTIWQRPGVEPMPSIIVQKKPSRFCGRRASVNLRADRICRS